MSQLFLKVVNMSISAGWIVLAVLVLRLVLRKAPKWANVLLWGLVALRLLCPFSVESVLSLIPSAETIPEKVIYGRSFRVQTGIAPMDHVVNDYLEDRYYEGITVPVNNGRDVMAVLAALWIVGMAVLLAYTVVSCLRLYRQVGTAVRLRENIYQSENVTSPFVFGIVRPRIYLPFQVEEQNISHIIAHEQAHIQRRDHWWKPFGFLLLTIYWFNPLMWLAYVVLCRDIELACDEKVIRELGDSQRADYSQALLACSVKRRTIAACPLAFGEVGVKKRVKSVLHYKKPAFWIAVAAVAVCMIAAVCFLTDPIVSWAGTAPFGYVYRVEKVLYRSSASREGTGGASLGDSGKGTGVGASLGNSEEGTDGGTLPGYFGEGASGGLAPRYTISADYALFTAGDSDEDGDGNGFVGSFVETRLTPSAFDDYFVPDAGTAGWENNTYSPKSIRKNAKQAWRLDVKDSDHQEFYYLILAKNGDVYLANGYEEESSEQGGSICWLSKLKRDSMSCYAASNGFGAYIGLSKYLKGTDWREEGISEGIVNGSGVLYFSLYGDMETLVVNEEYYRDYGDGVINVERAIYELPRNRDGQFALEVAHRGDRQEEAVYTIEDEEGVYIMKIIYIADEPDSAEDAVTDTALEKAVSAVILEHRAGRELSEGYLHVESHVVLDSKVNSGIPQADGENRLEWVRLYLLVAEREYRVQDGGLVTLNEGSSLFPAIITFSVDGEGGYHLEDYWWPQEGDGSQAIFPEKAAEGVLNVQNRRSYEEQLGIQCDFKAMQLLKSSKEQGKEAGDSLDVMQSASVTETEESRIESLLDAIQSSPLASSRAGDYIAEHASEYQELLGYGEDTLQYCFGEFLKGGQTDLRGAIMAIVCENICSSWGQELLADPAPVTGQEWFDMFRNNAEWLAEKCEEGAVETLPSASRLLLGMMEEMFAF